MAVKLAAVAVFSSILASSFFLADTGMAAPPAPAVANPVLVYLNKAGAIEVANADGSAKTVLRTNVLARRPTWSNIGDGTVANPWTIVYEANYCVTLKRFDVWKNAVTGALTTGPDAVIHTANADCNSAVDISPIGDKLVFGEGPTENPPSSLWTMNVAGGGEQAIFSVAGATITWASYNPEGTQIAFVQNGPSGTESINIINSNGTGPIITRLSTGGRFLEWSPDGSKLAFSGNCGGSSLEGICVMDVVGTVNDLPTRLTSGWNASWSPISPDSPDSTQLAFTGSTGVTLIDINTRKLTSLVRGADHPKFRN